MTPIDAQREGEQQMNEADALRAYFDAHMEMHAAIDSEKFGRAYVKANLARDTLLELARQRIGRG
jgi:hypothetical protein